MVKVKVGRCRNVSKAVSENGCPICLARGVELPRLGTFTCSLVTRFVEAEKTGWRGILGPVPKRGNTLLVIVRNNDAKARNSNLPRLTRCGRPSTPIFIPVRNTTDNEKRTLSIRFFPSFLSFLSPPSFLSINYSNVVNFEIFFNPLSFLAYHPSDIATDVKNRRLFTS